MVKHAHKCKKGRLIKGGLDEFVAKTKKHTIFEYIILFHDMKCRKAQGMIGAN